MKKEMLPPNCPRLRGSTYEIGKPWESPFISIHLSGEHPSMIGQGLSDETIYDFLRVMSADFYACWTLVAWECDNRKKTANGEEFIKLEQEKESATATATFWLNASKKPFTPKESSDAKRV